MKTSLSTLALIIAVGAPSLSMAQDNPDADVSPNKSVRDRFFQRPRGEAGIAVGLWNIQPSANVTASYVDNVFIDLPEEINDGIIAAGGDVQARSLWSRHEVRLNGGATRTTYIDNDTENFTEVRAGTSGRFDFGRASNLRVNADYRSTVEQRTALQTAAGSVEPVRFVEQGVGAIIDLRQTRFREELGIRFVDTNFDDAIAASDGSIIDQDFRDQQFTSAFVRQYIRLRPAVELFLQAEGRQRRFDNEQLALGAAQDSDSYILSGGLAFDIQKAARGEIEVGYQDEDFESDLFTDFSGFSARAAMEVFISNLTTVNLEGGRIIVPSAVIGAGGFFANQALVKVDHELFRNVLISGGVEYRREAFQDFDRTDTTYVGTVGATYLIGRHVGIAAEYIYSDVSSDGAFARSPFDQNIFRLRLDVRR
ncbi:MAG: outer membrane beta-barrel protein [Pseudomonadota bacterium]